jgi:short-subunit dehydrogenase
MAFWQGKCVIITGASSGIGRALAEELAGHGAKVGLIARQREKLAELAAALESAGRQAAFAPADVTDTQQVRQACQSLEGALGPCDVLIANAGIHRYTPGGAFNPDDANAVFATNVQGVVNTVGAVLPGMVARRRGHLVAVASIASMLGLPEVGAYSASKAAVVTLMESLRVDLHRYKVRVTTICPGFVDTPMIAAHGPAVLKFVLSPTEAAPRIAHAIERGRREYWFPWQMRVLAWVGRLLPFGIYRRVCARLPRGAFRETGGT